MKKAKGITLIALVITVVVLIILAGVAINLTIGENGIFSKAKYAAQDYTNASDFEQYQINTIEKYLEETTKSLKYDETKLDDKILLNNVSIDEKGIIEQKYSDSYITINKEFLPGNSSWEFATKFKFDSLRATTQTIIGKTGSHNPIVIQMQTEGKLQMDISSNGTNWNLVNKKTGNKVLQPETWYWIKLKFDGNSYQVLISEDGINYSKDIEEATSTIAYQKDKYVLGDNLYSAGSYKFYGYFDLKETYIKIVDNYFFNGLDYFSYK